MAHKINSVERFWKELKRRKVAHVVAIYTATAFVILELVTMVAGPLKLPEWTEALVIVLLCIGFVIAVLLSWIYDITPAGVRKTKPASQLKHVDHTTHEVSSGWKTATYTSAITIVALLAFNFMSKRNLIADISKLERSIAVLPFINESTADSNKYFINGIMEEVLTNLQTIKDFRVLSRTSTDQYRSLDRPTIPEIARKLDVNYIVEGSGQKYGNKFVLRVQLITGKNERHLWAKSYDREINQTTDIINVQSEIAQSIATELRTIITPHEKQLIEKIPTLNITAYDLYLRGEEEYQKYWLNPDNREALERAEDFYNEALKYDPNFALAFVGIANIYYSKHYWDTYFSDKFLDTTLLLADKALSIDDQLDKAYCIKGEYFRQKGNFSQSIKEYDKALQLNPNNWEIYYGKSWVYSDDDFLKDIENSHKSISLNRGAELPSLLRYLGYSYYQMGFTDKGQIYIQEALKLDKDSAEHYHSLCHNELLLANLPEAIELGEKGFALDSNKVSILYDLGFGYMMSEQYKESLVYFRKYLERLKASGESTINGMHRIGLVFWKNGYKEESEYYFNEQIKYCNKMNALGRDWSQKLFTYYDLASVYSFKGEKVKSIENLQIFNERKRIPSWIIKWCKTDPLFDNIRNEAAFQQIVKEMEVKYQDEQEKVRKWLEEHGML